jgi:hypothetical protein
MPPSFIPDIIMTIDINAAAYPLKAFANSIQPFEWRNVFIRCKSTRSVM